MILLHGFHAIAMQKTLAKKSCTIRVSKYSRHLIVVDTLRILRAKNKYSSLMDLI